MRPGAQSARGSHHLVEYPETVNFEILRAKSAELRGRQNRQEEEENAHLNPVRLSVTSGSAGSFPPIASSPAELYRFRPQNLKIYINPWIAREKIV